MDTQPAVSGRRQAIVKVSCQVLEGLLEFKPKAYPVFWTTAPKDIHILDVRWDSFSGCVELLCESQEFESVAEGELLPQIEVMYSTNSERPVGEEGWRST